MEFSSGFAGVERLSADTAVVVDLAEVTWCEIFAVIGDPRAKNHLFFLTLAFFYILKVLSIFLKPLHD